MRYLKVALLGLILAVPPVSALKAQATPATSMPQLHRLTPSTPAELQLLFRYTADASPLISAHRGGAGPGLPENCIATFEATLAHTYSLLEIDPRLTSDSEVIVLHDATLERTTNGSGTVAKQTWQELKQLRLKDAAGAVTEHSIPTLDEVLEWARGKTVLVLDQKDVPLETRINKIEQHHAEGYAMLIISSVKDAQACFRRNPKIMMEFMMGDRQKFSQFESSGVPWSSIIAFVGHTPPTDRELLAMIHAKGTSCMVGTSRNIDRDYTANPALGMKRLESQYRKLLDVGADIIETDLPREVGSLLASPERQPLAEKAQFFQSSSAK